MVATKFVTAVVAILAIVGMGLLVSCNRSDSQTIVVDVPQNSETITATIVASDVKDFAGAQFDLDYDPAVVSYQGISEGPFLDNGEPTAAMLVDSSSQSSGEVKNIVLFRVVKPGVDGSGTVAVASFKRIGPGDPRIVLQNVLTSDSNAKQLSSSLLEVVVA